MKFLYTRITLLVIFIMVFKYSYAQKCIVEKRIFIYDSNADSIRQAFLNCDTIICQNITFKLSKSTTTPVFPNTKYITGFVGIVFFEYRSEIFYDFPQLKYCTTIDIQGTDERSDTTRQYLKWFKAFPSLQEAESVNIALSISGENGNKKNILESLEGFNSIKKIGKGLTLRYFGKKLNGFKNLEEIGLWMHITETWIENLDEFSNLKKVGKSSGSINPSDLRIDNNPKIKSIEGLKDLILTPNVNGKLYIILNDSLSTCHIKSVCETIATNKHDIQINRNAKGCESVAVVKQQCLTATNDELLKFHVIYPNPTSGKVTINGLPSTAKVTILNFSGRVLKQMQLLDEQFDIEELPNGIYIVKIETKEYTETHKVVKIE